MQTGKCVRKHSLFTNCGAKLRLFLELTKYLLIVQKQPLNCKEYGKNEQETDYSAPYPTIYGHGFHRFRRPADGCQFCVFYQGKQRTLRRSLFHPGRNSRICIFIKKRISRSSTYPFYIFENLFPVTEIFNPR